MFQKVRYNNAQVAQISEGEVIQSEVVRARQLVGVGVHPGDHLAQNYAITEDVAQFVIKLAPDTFGRHPVRRSNRTQLHLGVWRGYGGGEAKVTYHGLEFAAVQVLDQYVLKNNGMVSRVSQF